MLLSLNFCALSASSGVGLLTPAIDVDQVIACQWMALFAVRFHGSFFVDYVRNQFKVNRITARTIATQMINLITPDTTSRDRTNRPSVNVPMYSLASVIASQFSIATKHRACPVPARTSMPLNGRIDLDFRENSNQVFGGKMINGKILRSHCENLRNRFELWSGSLTAETVCGPFSLGSIA